MANLLGTTGIYPSGEGYLIRYGIFNAANLSNTAGSYFHMKTNIGAPSTNKMIMLEAVGYNYGAAAPIRCSWNFYSYAYVIGNTQTSTYNGMTAHSIYVSSDNKYVIVGYASSLYYCGFTLNSYNTAGNGYGNQTTITASVQTTTATYY